MAEGIAKRVMRNTGFLYIRMAVSMFILLYTTRLVLNSLGTSDFGIFNIVGGVIVMLGFISASMAASTQRYLNYSEGEGDREKQKRIFNTSMTLHFFTALLVAVILVFGGMLFFNAILNIPPERMDAAKNVYYCLVFSTLCTVITAPYDAVLNAHENMRFYAIVGILESILKLLIAFVVVYSPYDKLIVYGVLMGIQPLVTLFIMVVYCHRHYLECRLRVAYYWDRKLLADMARFAGWNFISTMSAVAGNYGLGFVLNHFFGTLLNAAQGIATQFCGQLMAFSRNMLKALSPVVTKSEGLGNRDEMLQISLAGNKLSYFILAFFAIPSIIEMPFLLRIWLKNVPEWAVVFSRLMLVRTLIEQTTIVFITSLSAEGRIAGVNKWLSIVNILPLFIVAALFHAGFSPVVMYIVNIIIYGVVYSWVEVYFMKKNCDMPYMLFMRKVLLPVSVVTVLTYGFGSLPLFLMDEGILRLIYVCAATTIVFSVSGWFCGLEPNERQMIAGVLKSIKQNK